MSRPKMKAHGYTVKDTYKHEATVAKHGAILCVKAYTMFSIKAFTTLGVASKFELTAVQASNAINAGEYLVALVRTDWALD